MSTKKKVIVLVSMVLLLVATTTLNIVLGLNNNKGTDTPTGGVTQSDYYTAHRAQRQSDLDSLMLYYDSIINNTALESSAEKEAAAKAKLELLEASKKQSVMESAIKALGFDDAVVVIDTTGTNVYVVVKAQELTSEQMDSICSLIIDADPTVSDTDIRVQNVY